MVSCYTHAVPHEAHVTNARDKTVAAIEHIDGVVASKRTHTQSAESMA